VMTLPASKGLAQQVRVGEPDPSLTRHAGLTAVDLMCRKLDVGALLGAHIAPVEQRARGHEAHEVLLGVACAQLTGQDFMTGLDALRADPVVGLIAEQVGVLPSRTFAGIAARFSGAQFAGIEAGLAAITRRWIAVLPAASRSKLLFQRPTIDIDATDVEVHGPTKKGVAWTYAGQRAGRVHAGLGAEAGLALAADLTAGNVDGRPGAPGLLARALAGLPPQVTGRPRLRADAGYFDGALAHAADELGVDWAIAAKRTSRAWTAYTQIPDSAWVSARNMRGAQVAVIDYLPGGWPADCYTIVRRVRIDATTISADGRSRRRRTMHPDQLAPALNGGADHAYAVSFIVTNLPTDTPADVIAVQAWFRGRTRIEDLFRDGKHGAGMNHLPSADPIINAVWTWGALIATNLAAMLQTLTSIDDPLRGGTGRARPKRLPEHLICLPARIVRHARGLTLRPAPGPQLLTHALARLRALPAPVG